MITGFEHMGITVSDLDRSLHFYCGLLGMRLDGRFRKSEPYVQRVVGHYPDVTLEIAMLTIPGTETEFELIQYHGVDGRPVDADTGNPGTGHLSVFVDDLGTLYERLSAAGVASVSEPQISTAGVHVGKRLVYMKDPDGIRVELVETGAAA